VVGSVRAPSLATLTHTRMHLQTSRLSTQVSRLCDVTASTLREANQLRSGARSQQDARTDVELRLQAVRYVLLRQLAQ